MVRLDIQNKTHNVRGLMFFRLLGYEVAMHTSVFTCSQTRGVISIHRCKDDTYVFIGKRMTIIVSKINQATKGGGGVQETRP